MGEDKNREMGEDNQAVMRNEWSKIKPRFQQLGKSKQAYPFHYKKWFKFDIFVSNEMIVLYSYLFYHGREGVLHKIIYHLEGHGITKFENHCYND